MKWNINTIKNLLDEKKREIINVSSDADYQTLKLDIQYLELMINILNGERIGNYPVSSFNASVTNKYTANKDMVKNSHDLRALVDKISYISIPNINKMVNPKISKDDSYKLVYYTLENTQDSLLEMLSTECVFFDSSYNYALSRKSMTLPIIDDNKSFIYVKHNDSLSDSISLAFEMGHANIFNNININELINIDASLFNDTFSILNQLIFIDRLYNIKDSAVVNSLKHRTIINYSSMCSNISCLSTSASYVVALYLFNLYKNDYNTYIYTINMLKELIKTTNDKMILDSLDIDYSKVLNNYKEYIKEYK